MSNNLRYDSRKRLEAVKGLPSNLIKKFIIAENRDYRGRVTFHIGFRNTKNSKIDYFIVPKKYRVHSSLINAEIAIFEMVKIHLWQGEKRSQFKFISERPTHKNLIYLFKKVCRIIFDK